MPGKLQVSREKLFVFGAVCACFLLSGFAALLYQIAWMRQLSSVFGTSELAVATVLAAYMAGLAAGAAVAARIMHRIRRPVLVYGVLEFAIAVSALAVPFLLQLAGFIYVAIFGGQPAPPDASGAGQALFYLAATFAVLAMPTGCMGATLPMLTRYAVHSDEEVGPKVGLLYAINTLGAVAGTLAAAFILLPALGLMGTIVVGAIVNLLVFAIAALLARRLAPGLGPATGPRFQFRFQWQPEAWILPVMLVSGFATFCYEVLWTRLLSHVLGGSVVAFAIMLASFLSGIAIGSAIASRMSRTRESAQLGFVITQIAIAATSLIIYQSLDRFVPEVAGFSTNILFAVALMLPATLFIGATYPFAVRILSRDERDAAQASARVYLWNTLGAVIGAVVAGFFLIPLLRYEGTIKLVVSVNIALALIAALATPLRRRVLAGVSAVSLTAVILFFNPLVPEGLLRVSPLNDAREGSIRFYDVGRSATVLMMERDGFFYLRTNGLPEASADMKGAPPSMHSQRLLAALPVIARPEAKSMLIVGFGGGVVAENIPSSIQDVDIVELEPKVIEANRAIANERNIDPLLDPRITIIENDARNAMRLTDKNYDIIVSQPSHPWTAGASHLYTREYMNLVRSKLSAGGVFLQWTNVDFLNEELLRSIAATLLDVFPHIRAYLFEPNVIFFLASAQAIEPEEGLASHGEPLASLGDEYFKTGIGSIGDVVAALAWDTSGISALAADAAVITDNDNTMAMNSARAFEQKALSYSQLKLLLLQYGALYNSASGIYERLHGDVDYLYVGDRLAMLRAPELIQQLSISLKSVGDVDGDLLAAKAHIANGEMQQADRLLMDYLAQRPQNAQATYLLFAERRHAIVDDDVPQAIRMHVPNLMPDARAVLMAWDASVGGDFRLARETDNVLAMARREDQWYLRAAKLRADWRISAMRNGESASFGAEALEIIDEVIGSHQDLDFYGMRMAAAYLVEDFNAVVETARRMIWIISSNLRIRVESEGQLLSRREAASIARRVRAIGEGLSAVREQDRVASYKLDGLEQQITNLLQFLGQT